MTAAPRDFIFNAIGPALKDAEVFLRLSTRERLASSILDALSEAGYTVVPTAEYEELKTGTASPHRLT